MRNIRALIMGLGVCLVLGGLGEAQSSLDKMLKPLTNTGGSTAGKSAGASTNVAQGLKEALRLGTEKAVAKTGTTDGYFGNPLIKLVMPKQLQSVEKGLRMAGYGPQVDEFVLSMNRAAEAAAPQAKDIFVNAITSMTFAEANKILSGGDTAATDFFKEKSSKQLYDSFRPIVDSNMNKLGTVQKYNALAGHAQQIPFMQRQKLDVGDYVTNKALDGLFTMVATEEQRIRTNPAARTTDVLRQVFGK